MPISLPGSNDSPAKRRGRWILASVILGMIIAVAAITFLVACQTVTRWALVEIAGYQPTTPAGEPAIVPHVAEVEMRPWLLIPVATGGGLLAGWVARRFAPEAAGGGTDAAIRAYHQPNGRIRGRVALVKIFTTALTIGTGGSGGREGPMVQVGAGLGSWLAELFGMGSAGRRVLLAAGMGAGVAAVFRAPLAGALFAAEVLYRSEEFEPDVLIPAGAAAVTDDAVAGGILGWQPLFPTPPIVVKSPLHFATYALLTVMLVVLARVYITAFHRTSSLFARWHFPAVLKPALGAGLSALIGVGLFFAVGRDERVLAVLGFGLGPVQGSLSYPESYTIGLLLLIALGKIATTCLTIGSGGTGGVFGPALVIGGCSGAALGLALQPFGSTWVPPPAAFALLGMAGFFAAAAKTPFSTLIIVCELTGEFRLIAPTLGVCVACFVLSGRSSLFDSQPTGRHDSPLHRPPDGVP
jgi:CIC family chloride channel protein